MTTTVDEKRQEAKDKLDEAYKALLIVLDKDTWGHSDLTEEYVDKIADIAFQVLKLSRKI